MKLKIRQLHKRIWEVYLFPYNIKSGFYLRNSWEEAKNLAFSLVMAEYLNI